ncbi:MAG: glycosyltransferase family 4 protein [Chthonomonadales bacterium]|nr:glycosyltransferase family 4 protein [Chthonomonadales bacterium]
MSAVTQPSTREPGVGRLRVAFFDSAGAGWTGGVHYLRNLCLAIRSLGDEERPEILFVATSGAVAPALVGLADRVVEAPRGSEGLGLGQRLINRVHRRTRLSLPAETSTSRRLRAEGASVVFGCFDPGEGLRLPFVGWIPDFQHVRLAAMFAAEERGARDAQFRALAERAALVVLSSRDARADFEGFAPEHRDKARVLPFVASIPGAVYEADPAWVCRQYRLPERFFYLPNQFWKHKNHRLVLDALDILRDREPDVVVVCTGNSSDHRNPTYFGELLADISARGLRERMVVLGMVPSEHILPLMRQSVALLQPSLFEGWSTTVEEAKSLGKRAVLSDLVVHREQDPPRAAYFDRSSAEDLASVLSAVWRDAAPGPNLRLEAEARAAFTERQRGFGRMFARAVEEAADGRVARRS